MMTTFGSRKLDTDCVGRDSSQSHFDILTMDISMLLCQCILLANFPASGLKPTMTAISYKVDLQVKMFSF